MSSAALSGFGAALPVGNGENPPYSTPVVRAISTAQPHRFTVSQVEEMVKLGFLNENDRCELIRGELIEKMTLGDPHMAAVRWLNRFFNQYALDQCLVSVQDAIRLADSRPEPDVSILVRRDDLYRSRTPTPTEILLLVEVADSSLAFDRAIKGPLYAQNGIAEYWIVNLIDQQIEVHRQPQIDGTYAQTSVVRRPESISPLALPKLSISVLDILGPG